jgi:hypothetical protein
LHFILFPFISSSFCFYIPLPPLPC